MSAKELATNPRVGAAIGAVTAGTGIWTILDWIPSDIGKVATLVGIILSLVLIYVHFMKGRAEIKKIRLETEILIQQHQELEVPDPPKETKPPHADHQDPAT